MKMSERDRRDWSLLIFILPLGILLMFIAGQFAIRIIPRWILAVTMGSNLKVDTAGGQQTFMEPLFNVEILTPFAWQDDYLTPNADKGFVFPPFVVLEPSATPSPTEAPSLTETATPPPPVTVSPSATTVTPSATVVVTATTPPPPTSTEVSTTSPTTCQDPAATNNGGPLPCVYPPTTCTDPAANNNGGSLPCVYPVTTTLDPATYTQITPPSSIGLDVPPDGNVGGIADGKYVILGITVVVGDTPDNYYDLVFYEFQNGGSVLLDSIIIGISKSSDGNNHYYEVFNWGNGTPDENSNANINNLPPDPNCPSNTECDNRKIPVSNLYPSPGTGILIDVDHASSNPPPGSYDSVWIISPVGTLIPSQAAQVDSIQATEVPIPPTP